MVGGRIGARITGIVARVLMDVWVDKLAGILSSNNVMLLLLAKYLNYINMVQSDIPSTRNPALPHWFSILEESTTEIQDYYPRGRDEKKTTKHGSTILNLRLER